ncbi:MAG: threonine-phosphate decarboxylase CobD [Geitlerinemataceae cyanobacterium]
MNRPIHGGNLAWAASIAGCPASSILDFSASINPLGPPRSAIAAIQAGIPNLKAYPDPEYRRLRQVLGQMHQLPPEWILPGNGAAELLTWAGRDLARLDVTYSIAPAFSDYERSLRAFGGRVESLPLWSEENWQAVFDRPSHLFPIPPSVSGKRAGLILNNPHNPTGILWRREDILPDLQRFALVVADEAFMEFLPPDQQESLIPVVQQCENLIVIRSLTKFYSIPGLRLGYAIAHPDRLQRWQQWRDPWSVNTLAAAVGEAVVDDPEFERQTWNWLSVERSRLLEGFAQLGLRCLKGRANFLLVRSPIPSSQLQQILLQRHRILIRDCLSFPELGDRYFRVAVRTQSENQRLLDALKELIVDS